MPAATTPASAYAAPLFAAQVRHAPALAHLSSVRVAGTLRHDAVLGAGVGADPHGWLVLDFQPPHGLPYHARIDMGTTPTDLLAAREHLPHLRAGALVSVEGDALELRTDHGTAVLRVVRARNLVIPIGYLGPQAPAAAPAVPPEPQQESLC